MTDYVEAAPDVARADAGLVDLMRGYFAAKNSQSPDALAAFFARGASVYADGTLGWVIPGWEAIHKTFVDYMPKWTGGRSYPTRILGGSESAVIMVTDTPELFGGEIRQLACVDFDDGKIVRWVDYWDSNAFPAVPYHLMAKHGPFFPDELGVPSAAADHAMSTACSALHEALATGENLPHIFTYDAVWEDMALRAQVVGRSAIAGMLQRSRALLPFGPGAKIRHILGSAHGGGYEWVAQPESALKVGATAIEMDGSGRLSRVTAVYDGRHLPRKRRRELLNALSD